MILRSLRVILRSLRARIVAGALLWSVGLLVLVDVVSRIAARMFPALGRINLLLVSMTGTFSLLAGLLIVGSGLRKLDTVRTRVEALRAGRGQRLKGGDLSEIEPLVRDMNELLDDRERVVRRALATAGDLAHGLKTPLALVAQEAECLESGGHHDSAVTIAEQVERMRRQIDLHLARARASASRVTYATRIEVRQVTERLVRAMSRLYAGKGLDFAIEMAPSSTVLCETEDLEEMLGNILDNACKWARSRVAVTAAARNGDMVILVDDDGPGIDPASRERVLQRGVRADETAPGSGLGLAIASELAELYGGSLTLHAAPSGGVRVHLVLPSAG
ncbi:MAG TPA: ATP-binding protein [Thermoanaerobaculia bacterium]|jgi:signal transduction histidine kinase|nr:ATP-binding protein [Thermoanaerobaculia bacterium]